MSTREPDELRAAPAAEPVTIAPGEALDLQLALGVQVNERGELVLTATVRVPALEHAQTVTAALPAEQTLALALTVLQAQGRTGT